MAKKEKTYRKLPGTGRRAMGYSKLWQAKDHLLLVTGNTMSETYRRFYFSDIQALQFRKNFYGKAYNIAFAGLLLLFLAPEMFSSGDKLIVTRIMAAIWAVLLTVNLIKGSTCTTTLLTAVQSEPIPSLHRVRNTQRVLRAIVPLIEAAQGPVSGPQTMPSKPTRMEQITTQQPSTRQVARPGSARIHLVLFLLLAVDGMLSFANLHVQHTALTLLASTLFMAMLLAAIIALIRQIDTDLDVRIKRFTWCCAIYLLLFLGIGYGVTFYLIIQNPSLAASQWDIIRAAAALSPQNTPWIGYLYGISAFTSSALAAIGLWLLTHRREPLPAGSTP